MVHRFRVGNNVYGGSVSVNQAANTTETIDTFTATVKSGVSTLVRYYIEVAQNFNGTYFASVTTNDGYINYPARTTAVFVASQMVTLVTIPTNDAYTIKISHPSSGAKSRITYTCGKASGTIVEATTAATTHTWTPPASLLNQSPDSEEFEIKLTVSTYDESKGAWYANAAAGYFTLRAKAAAAVAPSVSISVTDGNGYADIFNGNFLHSKSTFKVVSTGTESYGSPIYSYLTTITGKTEMNEDVNLTLYGEEATSDITNIVGSVTIKTTATDGRGRSGSATVVKTAIKYEPPTITDLAVHRCDQDGTENDQGSYVSFTFSSAVQSLSNKNTAKYWYLYKSSADTTYTSQELTALANNYAVSGHTVIIPAEQNYSYVIIVRVQDKVMMTERATQASTAATVLDFKASGHGVALGKVSEEEDTFECNYKAHFYKQVKFDVPPDLPGMTVDEALTENGTNPVQGKAIYAALKNHAAQEAGSTQAGHVKLLDQAGGSYDAGAGYAATPKALDDALNAAFEVTGGGTGRGYLTPDSFLVGNGNSAVQLKTPAQVRDAIKDDTGWKTYSTSYPCVQYRKVNDIVYVCAYSGAQVNLTAGAYTTVGRVDASYAPSVSIYFSANTVGGGKAIDGFVGLDGYVKLYSQVSTGYWAFSVSYPI